MQWSNRARFAAPLGAILAIFLAAAVPALAADLVSAKSAGHIGEGPDGYLHVVDPNAPADAKALVADVNAKRKAKYQSIAKQNSAPFDAVAAQAGAMLIERTPPGQYVLNADGSWRRK
jgi:uncharacterized protein YdbL (DUF1318 family)